MREVIQHALESGQAERITPHGLTKGDIIEYLPVQALVPEATSWPDLRSQHRAAKNEKSGKPNDFKKWLEITYKADFGADAMTAAIKRMDALPADLHRLLKTVEAHTTA